MTLYRERKFTFSLVNMKVPLIRMKELANGNKSLYLDIYRDGKRTYEYLKIYIIPETDYNACRQNQTVMVAVNAIKSKRIIQMINSEVGIENREKFFWIGWIPIKRIRQNERKRTKSKSR